MEPEYSADARATLDSVSKPENMFQENSRTTDASCRSPSMPSTLLLVMALGLVHGNPMFAGAGVVFLVVFTGTYFYGIDTTMFAKSVTLVATGGAILLARRVLISFADRSEGRASA